MGRFRGISCLRERQSFGSTRWVAGGLSVQGTKKKLFLGFVVLADAVRVLFLQGGAGRRPHGSVDMKCVAAGEQREAFRCNRVCR